MRQVRYRAVITLDPAQPGTVVPKQRHWHRHHGSVLVPHPRSTAQSGPEAPQPAGPAADEDEVYLNHTRELVFRAESRDKPGSYRSFATELSWDDEVALHPGDRHVVTVTLTEDDADRFFGPGQRFTLWKGAEVGHGTITRPMFSYTHYGPC